MDLIFPCMKVRFLFSILFLILSCGPAKNVTAGKTENLDQDLQNKNRITISLLNRIRQLPGVIIRNGVPIINKASNFISNETEDPAGFGGGNPEPLYVLDGYIVGNSFRDIDRLVDNMNVKEVVVLTGSDASEYGSRGAKGVIKITTY